MLEELKKYENLGTIGFFYELFELVNGQDLWSEADINDYFYNKIIDDRRVYDGCMPLLKSLGIVLIDSQGFLEVPFSYKEKFNSIDLIKKNLVEKIILKLKNDPAFVPLFSNNNIEFDYVNNAISVNKNTFGLKYSNFMRLLTNLGFFQVQYNLTNSFLIINSDWEDFFISHFSLKLRKKKTLEQLYKQLEIQNKYGEDAEKFALEFEKIRLSSTVYIHWIAPFDVGAGYDILSIDNMKNKNKRCIEVKSYSGGVYFYWSSNEVEVAEKEKNNYFLYLVDRGKMGNEDYSPIMIQNPYKSVFNNKDWSKELQSQSWKFEQKRGSIL
jgi:hypothetical protein